MKTLGKHQQFTYILFFILLAVRISLSLIALISSGYSDVETIPTWVSLLGKGAPWINAIYMSGAFVLIAFVIILNQDDLQSLNIDAFFIVIFVYSGLAIFLEYIYSLGCLAGIAAILFSIYSLSKNRLKFGNIDPNAWRISLIVISIFIVLLILVSDSTKISNMEQALHLFFFETIPMAVYEEAIYRGILWKYLRNLRWSEPRIFFFQAILFWITHVNYLIENPFNFWVFIPILSLVLGFIVLRSKSIAPSTIAHMLINLIYGLISTSI